MLTHSHCCIYHEDVSRYSKNENVITMQQRIYTLTGRTGQRLTVLKVDASNGNISGAKVHASFVTLVSGATCSGFPLFYRRQEVLCPGIDSMKTSREKDN